MSDHVNSTGVENSYAAVQKFSKINNHTNSMYWIIGGVSRKDVLPIKGLFPVNFEFNDGHAVVQIIGDSQFERDYFCEYTSENCTFALINQTLIIKGKDRWGNPLEFNISVKRF